MLSRVVLVSAFSIALMTSALGQDAAASASASAGETAAADSGSAIEFAPSFFETYDFIEEDAFSMFFEEATSDGCEDTEAVAAAATTSSSCAEIVETFVDDAASQIGAAGATAVDESFFQKYDFIDEDNFQNFFEQAENNGCMEEGSAAGLTGSCSPTIGEFVADFLVEYCNPRAASVSLCRGNPAPPIGGPPPVVPPTGGPTPRFSQLKSQPVQTDGRSFQYVVALRDAEGNVACSGVLMDASRILTAGHCVCPKEGAGPLTTAYIGSDTYEEQGFFQVLELTALNAFPGFCEVRDPLSVDLAVLEYKSQEPVHPWFFGDFSPPSSVPEFATAVGWGASEDNLTGGTKQSAEIPLATCHADDGTGCRPQLEIVSVNSADSFVDTCFGDSGGPVVLGDQVVGITSRGRENGDSSYCGSGGIYVSLVPEGNPRYGEIVKWMRQ